MDKKDFSNLGNDIRDIVKNSINSGDYHKMGRDVGSTVNNALEIAFEEVRKAVGTIQMNNQQQKAKELKKPTEKKQYQPIAKQMPKPIYFPHNPVGRVAGTLLTVFGSMGIGLIGTSVLILGMVGVSPEILAGFLVLLSVSVMMELRGSSIRKRLKRYKRYLSLFYGRNSCPLDELSSYCGYSERFLVKDLRKMIGIGMFPQAHIDRQKTLIMLTRERYENYLEQQLEYSEIELKDKQRAIGKNKTKSLSNNLELDHAIEEGKVYIQQINDEKSKIKDVEVSDKIHRMEDTIKKILDYIENHPDQLSDVRRFMQYYLPTTIKLLNAYNEFERQPIQGENITTAEKEIKDALDTINSAFENLFDSLFASASMDVSTDISVLNTMLAQEGLTEQDFDLRPSEGGKNDEF